jgi:hypothetical protein
MAVRLFVEIYYFGIPPLEFLKTSQVRKFFFVRVKVKKIR